MHPTELISKTLIFCTFSYSISWNYNLIGPNFLAYFLEGPSAIVKDPENFNILSPSAWARLFDTMES